MIKMALRPLNRLYGSTRAAAFGPLALKAVQMDMVGLGWSRGVINKQIVRVRQMFKWAIAQEMIPSAIHQALTALPGLKRGKTDAREPAPVKPVPRPHVDAVLNEVSPIIADMIRLQLLTGARPGEICGMKVGSVDTRGKVWICKPIEHKTAHRGHGREIRIGPLAKRLSNNTSNPTSALTSFLPRMPRSGAASGCASFANRRCSHRRFYDPNRRKRRRRQQIGDHYKVSAYRLAIWRGCDRASPPPPPLAKSDGETLEQWKSRLTTKQRQELRQWRSDHRWHPHQLRHNFATEVRRQHGIEMAKIILGHRSVAQTEIYAEADVQKATEIMGAIG